MKEKQQECKEYFHTNTYKTKNFFNEAEEFSLNTIESTRREILDNNILFVTH